MDGHENSPHGMKGDFRKVTVTLPPAVYERLLQESARRKVAGEPNNLLSAIAREGIIKILSGEPLLPIEATELKIYRYADAQGFGEWRVMDSIAGFSNAAGQTVGKLFDQLVADTVERGMLAVEKFDRVSNRYLPFAHWGDPGKVFYSGDTVRMMLTIPGRRRYEGLKARERLTQSARRE